MRNWLKQRVATLENRSLRNQIYALKEFLRAQPRPILVYQMSKVGSTSVYRSLQKAGLSALHVHQITGFETGSTAAYIQEHGRAPTIDVYVGNLLSPYLKWTSHRLKVISLVRDPVARCVSMLHHWSHHSAESSAITFSNVDETQQAIVEWLARPETLEEGMFTWFDREIKSTLNVDVMSGSFDPYEGYGVCQGTRATVLVVKLERLSGLLPTVVSKFVGTSLEDTRANVGRDRGRRDSYAQVKRSLQLPASVCTRIYNHDWVRHFYTKEEISAFKSKWTA